MLEVIALPIAPQPLANSNRGIYWLVIESNCSLVDWAWSYYKITALSNLRVASLIGRYIRTYMPTVDWWKKSSHLTVTIHLNCLTGLIGFHKKGCFGCFCKTQISIHSSVRCNFLLLFMPGSVSQEKNNYQHLDCKSPPVSTIPVANLINILCS